MVKTSSHAPRFANSVFALVFAACGASPVSDGSAPPPKRLDPPPKQVSTPPPTKAEAPPVDPPPPAGVILPVVGRPREVFPGSAKTAYRWKAIYEVDASDPAVVEAMASDAATPGWDAGDAGRYLYEDHLEAQGVELTRGPGTAMYYQTGDLVVTANSGPQFHLDDPSGFTVWVGPAGG